MKSKHDGLSNATTVILARTSNAHVYVPAHAHGTKTRKHAPSLHSHSITPTTLPPRTLAPARIAGAGSRAAAAVRTTVVPVNVLETLNPDPGNPFSPLNPPPTSARPSELGWLCRFPKPSSPSPFRPHSSPDPSPLPQPTPTTLLSQSSSHPTTS
ncbi:hypothetical protein PAXRUDRAFT_833059 [Paxillus rubicundulus Ve08.2h10]|uniref:Uncharacterized protein n=1 Tax=Paxillus rubicundulus Ve08.2h10 TaxID=930991 RepID=A0A0D0DHZ7_9AGAM|nr:hypothetical protein PAXRUDRAFT_833059 [Paxillus rubicundulus Ve08.2h10]